ncbi:hypothetical protein PG991_007847 [Apiospora marii]|uniref:alpha-L-rhamnosidase n=1 Tax=Apiospora marii TaxID=335849 RepID=A0ABR1RUT7_9PEZI
MANTPQPLMKDLRIEHHPTGLGIPHTSPRISWEYGHQDGLMFSRNWLQVSYEIQMQRTTSNDPAHCSYTVKSRNNILVPWPFEPLGSRERVRVRVRASGGSCTDPTNYESALAEIQPAWTDWTDWVVVEAALLDRRDWQAQFINCSTSTAVTGADQKIEYFRPFKLYKDFLLQSTPPRARLYITALGVYQAYINSIRVGDEYMAPGWTSYHKRLQYQVFDVVNLLKDGNNNITIHVAEGWYAGRLLWDQNGVTCFYGDRIGALAQLEVYTAADDLEPAGRICSDISWGWRLTNTTSSSIYDGEHYEVCDSSWNKANIPPMEPAAIIPFPSAELLATPCPPVQIVQTVKPKEISKSPSGKTLVDFGQNLVGRIHIPSLERPAGHILTIRHAELLEHNELGTRPLRSARATDTITFRSTTRLKNWNPLFTFHGFRYIEITGWSPEDAENPLTLDSIYAQVLSSAIKRHGWFECSNESLNRFHRNVEWSIRSNFLSIPTDCPQRDERLGWTGDIQVFAPTASFIFDCAGMLSNWLQDLVIDQEASDGVVPFVVPDVMTKAGPLPAVPQAVWDDVVVLLPWTIYLYTGDKTALRTCWDGMRKYVDEVIPKNDEGLWDPQLWQLGDWLDPAAPPDDPGAARTDGTLVADAYLFHVTRVMHEISKVLNEDDVVISKYHVETLRLGQAFRRKYMTPTGLLVGDSQTSLALALVFGLHDSGDDRRRAAALSRLVRLVRTAKFKVNTGFAGTPAVLPALASVDPSRVEKRGGAVFGQEDTALQTAYQLLLSTECPSILYPVTKGATTIWERWDSMLPDGRINSGEMTSFNHYALGSVADWLHTVVGGLSPYMTPTLAPDLGVDDDAVGWRKIRIHPQPGGDLKWCETSYRGGSGLVRCRWRLVPDSLPDEWPNKDPDDFVEEPEDMDKNVGDGRTKNKRFRFIMNVTIPPNTTAVVFLPDADDPDDPLKYEMGSGVYLFKCAYRDPGRWPPKPIESFNWQGYLDRNKEEKRVPVLGSFWSLSDNESWLKSSDEGEED